jgi:hypothetical protein
LGWSLSALATLSIRSASLGILPIGSVGIVMGAGVATLPALLESIIDLALLSTSFKFPSNCRQTTQNIEDLAAELEFDPLVQFPDFGKKKVPILEGRTAEAICVHLYERFMTYLFEIYAFSYPIVWVE